MNYLHIYGQRSLVHHTLFVYLVQAKLPVLLFLRLNPRLSANNLGFDPFLSLNLRIVRKEHQPSSIKKAVTIYELLP